MAVRWPEARMGLAGLGHAYARLHGTRALGGACARRVVVARQRPWPR